MGGTRAVAGKDGASRQSGLDWAQDEQVTGEGLMDPGVKGTDGGWRDLGELETGEDFVVDSEEIGEDFVGIGEGFAEIDEDFVVINEDSEVGDHDPKNEVRNPPDLVNLDDWGT